MEQLNEKEIINSLKDISNEQPRVEFVQELEAHLTREAQKMENRGRVTRITTRLLGIAVAILLMAGILSPQGQQWIQEIRTQVGQETGDQQPVESELPVTNEPEEDYRQPPMVSMEEAYGILYPSAAAPATGRAEELADLEYTIKKAMMKINNLYTYSPNEMEKAKELYIEQTDYWLIGDVSLPHAADETIVLAYRVGKGGMNMVNAHVLIWYDNGTWRSQLYPQAPDSIAQQRYDYFSQLGANCPIGCAGGFTQLRQEGNRLLAVVDLSSVGTRKNEEVHLLVREENEWKLIWAPTPDEYSYEKENSIEVRLPEQGIDRFTVSYDDQYLAEWEWEGKKYSIVESQK